MAMLYMQLCSVDIICLVDGRLQESLCVLVRSVLQICVVRESRMRRGWQWGVGGTSVCCERVVFVLFLDVPVCHFSLSIFPSKVFLTYAFSPRDYDVSPRKSESCVYMLKCRGAWLGRSRIRMRT